MSLASLLTQTAAVYRNAQTTDAIGGVTRALSVSTASLPCLVQPLRADERVVSGATGVVATHKMFCAATADIDEADEIHVGATIYQVTGISNQRDHHLEVELLEHRPSR